MKHRHVRARTAGGIRCRRANRPTRRLVKIQDLDEPLDDRSKGADGGLDDAVASVWPVHRVIVPLAPPAPPPAPPAPEETP